MKNNSVAILEKVLKLTGDSAEKAKKIRLTELLKSPQDNGTSDWFMYVPSCFNNPLDIRLTQRKMKGKETLVWTQGSAFSFKPGDTLYDTSKAYEEWREALKHISLCISVQQAMDAVPEKRKGLQGEIIPRNPGSIHFTILTPTKNRANLAKIDEVQMTQDEFVFFLIVGPDDGLRKRIRWKQ